MTRELVDTVSSIEFIRSIFDVEIPRERRFRREATLERDRGRQMLELLLRYDAYRRPIDDRDPYAGVALRDVVGRETVTPIFDAELVMADKMTVAKKTEAYAGYLRNVRDAYVANKTVNTFAEHMAVSAMYAGSMATIVRSKKESHVPVDISRRDTPAGHVAFRLPGGKVVVRRRTYANMVLITQDESTDTNVIGTRTKINTRHAGRREEIAGPVLWNFIGLEFPGSAAEETREFSLPDETEAAVRAIVARTYRRIFFKYPKGSGAGSAASAVRAILAAGLDDLAATLALRPVAAWKDVLAARTEDFAIGSVSVEDVRKSVSRAVSRALQAAPGAAFPRLTTEVAISVLDAQIDDLVREVFYSTESRRRKLGEIAEAELMELVGLTTNLIDGVYYSKFTGDELEFFQPIVEETDGLTFDQELMLLTDNFREEDFASERDLDSGLDRIQKIYDITGGSAALDKASLPLRDGFEHKAAAVPADTAQRAAAFPATLGLRHTDAAAAVPATKSTAIAEIPIFAERDAYGESIVLDALAETPIADLFSAYPELEDSRLIKTRIIAILDKYSEITGTDYTRRLNALLDSGSIDISGAVFKIGTFDNIFDERGREFELTRAAEETWRFATAFRQELAVASNFEYVDPRDEAATAGLSQMHVRTLVARSRLRAILPADVFERLGMPAIPNPATISAAFARDVYATDARFLGAVSASQSLALVFVAEILGRIFAYVSGERVELPALRRTVQRPAGTKAFVRQGQEAVLRLVEDVFLNVLSEELVLREYTDIYGPSAKWVLQELWTESKIRAKSWDDKFDDDDEDPMKDISVPDDESLEEAEESWALQDSIAEELSTFFSEFDD